MRRHSSIQMTSQNLWSGILLFSLPLMASNLLQVLFNMADVAVVGQFAGTLSLGAVGSTTILVSLFTGLLIGLGNGINVQVAHRIGAGQEEGIRITVHTSLILAVIYGLVIMALGEALAEPVLLLLGTKEELLQQAQLYFRIYLLGLPALAVYNFGNAVYSAAGNTRKPLAILSLAGVVNVAGNLLFVIVFRMDVVGVALASALSQYLSAFLIVLSLFRCREKWGLRRDRLGLNRRTAGQVLQLAIPSGMQNAIFAVANLFIQSGVNSFSAVMVSGNAAAANADSIIYDVMAAVYTACASFMGQNYGAGKRKRVMQSYLIALLYSFLVGLILGLGIMFNGRTFLGLFSRDEQVIEAGLLRLNIMGFSYCVSAFMDNTIAACRALGKTLVPTVAVILGSCLFRILWIYTVFAHFRTIPSLYLVYIFSWTITSAVQIAYFLYVWRHTFTSGGKTDKIGEKAGEAAC